MIYCYQNKSVTAVVKTLIEFALDSRGYFYKWVEHVSDIKAPAVLIIYGTDSGTLPPGINALNLPVFYDLNALNNASKAWQRIQLSRNHIPVLHPESSSVQSASSDRYRFDLVANLFFHLSRMEEQNCHHPDDIDRSIHEFILAGANNFSIPVVDILIEDFGHFLDRFLARLNIVPVKKALYPGGETMGLAITHDVDIVRAYHPLKKFFLRLLIASGLIKNKSVRMMKQEDQRIWAFDRLLEYYRKFHLRASFFFIARYTEGRHFRYRIRGTKFRKLFRELQRDQHEIGLHPSRYAFEHRTRYQREKKKLEKTLGERVHGMRQHYLRCLYPQIWTVAEQLGLTYDTSLAYRRNHGFRAGTSHPYKTFNHQDNQVLSVYECPLIFFEESLPELGRNVGLAKKTIINILETIAHYKGLFTFLWHPGNCYNQDHFQEIWAFITEQLTLLDAFIAPLHEQLEWIQFRNSLDLDRKTEDGSNRYILTTKKECRPFTLIFEKRPHIERVENAAVEWLDETHLKIVPETADKHILLQLKNTL